jgi:hypothetical protein
MGRTWADDFEYWMQNMTDSEIRAEQAEDLRADREALTRIAAKLADFAMGRHQPEDEGRPRRRYYLWVPKCVLNARRT